MKKRKGITRREFNVGAMAAGAGLMTNGISFSDDLTPDIACVEGNDPAAQTREAVGAIGGMGAFVKEGQTVDILINFMGRIEPAHTDPDVFAEVYRMIKEAGASRIRLISWLEENRRRRNKLEEAVRSTGIEFHHVPQENPELWQDVKVPRGQHLKHIRIFKAIEEADVFITIPSYKHHGSASFSGAMKLAMGTTIREDNRALMHTDRGKYLEQAIADLNTVSRAPDLIVVDAFEILTTNGPSGPGAVESPKKIMAGTDRLALDTFCAPLMKINPETSIQLKAARAHNIGEGDLSRLNILERSLI